MEKIQVNINYRYEGFTPIKTACCYGNATAVQKLLNHKNLKIHCTDNLLITVITKLDKIAGWEFSDYYSCFYALLNSNKIDINETDQKGYSALHYAIMENNYKPVEELLKHGAYIGARNIFNEFAITNLNSVIIEKCFDSCITAKGSSVASHKAFSNININYINLVPPKTEELISTEPSTEMTIIEHISNTNYLRNLIKHPLIKSFLYMKWLQLAILFHINFIFYLQYFISLLLLTIATFTNFTGNNDISLIVLLSIGIAYLIIRESIQLIMFPKNYYKSISNYFEHLLIIITILFLEAVVNDDIKRKKNLAVTVILMAVLELYLLITSLQYLIISEYMLMFKKVLFTFIRSFAVFFIIILTFSLCFFILLHNENAVIVNITETNSTDYVVGKHEDQNEFNKFTNYIAIVKTIVMMTGEYDGSNINFNSSFSYLIFLLFIFLVPIVIFNLLSGLAVDDAKEIRNEAILYQSINLINNLSKYDKIFTRKIRPGRISFKNFRRWLQKLYIKYFILFNDEHKILEYRLESNIFNNNKILVKTFKDSNSMIWSTKTNLESNLKTYINIISTWLKLDINFNNAVLSVIAKKQPN